jgi:hypothetical protein
VPHVCLFLADVGAHTTGQFIDPAGGPELAFFVQFHDMLYSLFRDILYSFAWCPTSAAMSRSGFT